LLTRELLNVDRLMWGSDYPHTEGTFPRSREQVAKDFAGLDSGLVSKLVGGNCRRLYGGD
jgi:predicted TIM-barrel fold metal-dependent hydrolase